MKTTNINGVELTEDSLKMLQHWQEDEGIHLAETLEVLSDLTTFLSDASLNNGTENQAMEFIRFICVLRSDLKTFKPES
ncbi:MULTISPECIES: hypothetical protein [Capnocytophaga]|uniref:hypothetical protein n=1 Tax=Capnocytophaga TaxID=1016 RepID=UPI000F515F37|nr:hypothetical protein [Capnocytophaga canimorsus]AYW36533.1 hypothetical protein D8L92_03925 [Capnocytophaga canimorsus]